MIERITDKDRKEQIARVILLSLPAWFGIPESTRTYIEACRELPFWAAFEDGRPVGFLALQETGPRTVELHVMGVLPEYHRRGIGAGLWEAAKTFARAQGYLYAQVKTVACGRYPEYDRTNAFYRAMGFEELECFPALWDARNPCQIYVQYLGG